VTLQKQTEDYDPYVVVKVYGSPLDKQRLVELRNNTSQKKVFVWMSSDVLLQLATSAQLQQHPLQQQMYPLSVRLTIDF
jgi:hypothetical protein